MRHYLHIKLRLLLNMMSDLFFLNAVKSYCSHFRLKDTRVSSLFDDHIGLEMLAAKGLLSKDFTMCSVGLAGNHI